MIKDVLSNAMKDAMRAKEVVRLAAIRLMLSEIKQWEVDNRDKTLDDAQTLSILDKMCKQRRDSMSQFKEAGRDDLVAKEQEELDVIATFMPKPLSDEELTAIVKAGIEQTGAKGMQDMGKLMAVLRPELVGRADMVKVSGLVKQLLS